MKIDQTLLIYFIAYNLITTIFISAISQDQSASLGYIIMFPFFWILAGIVLGLLFRSKKIDASSWLNKILLLCSTPIPVFILFVFHGIFSSGLITSSYEYNKNGHRHKEIKYQYSEGGQIQRVEYYISKDEVTETNPFPLSDTWLKDSVWTYYNRDGTVEKKEDYKLK